MSYEGYEDVLCQNGHLHQYDCMDSAGPSAIFPWDTEEKNWKCPTCNAPAAHIRGVDETNGCYPDQPWTVSFPYKTKEEGVYEKCNLGHLHCTKEKTFQIPTKEEIKQWEASVLAKANS